MESESQAKIAIRGKGSVKEGKGRSDAAHTSNQEEDLHCLIMADTEEKVNKARQLIHNVIETVCLQQNPRLLGTSTKLSFRPHQYLKDKMSSSGISSANLLLSMVRSVTTKTKLAKTVVRLAIANTTVLKHAISLPILSVALVAMLDIWLAIAPNGDLAKITATSHHLEADLQAVLAVVMLLTRNTNASCRSSMEARLATILVLVALKLVLAGMTTLAAIKATDKTRATSSPGSAVLPVLPHLGLNVVVNKTMIVRLALHGLITPAVEADLLPGTNLHQALAVPLPGSNKPRHRLLVDKPDMADMATVLLATATSRMVLVILAKIWVRHQDLVPLLVFPCLGDMVILAILHPLRRPLALQVDRMLHHRLP
jgi:hypothetical protein